MQSALRYQTSIDEIRRDLVTNLACPPKNAKMAACLLFFQRLLVDIFFAARVRGVLLAE